MSGKFIGEKSVLTGLVFTVMLFTSSFAQRRPMYNSTSDERNSVYVFKNATVWLNYKTKQKGCTLIVKNGKIERIGQNLGIPESAQTIDLTGKYVYPSFIDLYSEYGIPRPQQASRTQSQGPRPESRKKGVFHQNQAIRPETNAVESFNAHATDAEELRKLGFGVVLTAGHDGIVSGTSALVKLADKRENELVIKEKAASHFSFNKGTSTQDYPGSVMGAVALLRQTFLDAAYYKSLKNPKEHNLSLEAWNQQTELPKIFETQSALSILTADKIGDEFGVQYIVKGSGDEYRMLKELKATGAPLIIPVNFPDAYDVEDPWDASQVSLTEMKHWELAPTNAAKLIEADIPFVFTTSGLKNKQDFRKNILKCIRYGLGKEEALKALTYMPAKLLGLEKTLGSLEPGMQANFMITSGDLFDEETILYENIVGGERYVINDLQLAELRGTYNLALADGVPPLKLEISGNMLKPTFDLKLNDTVSATQVKGSRSGNFITLSFDLSKDHSAGLIRMSGYFKNDTISGQAQMPSGNLLTYKAIRIKSFRETKKENIDTVETVGSLLYPFSAYGKKEVPEAKTWLIRGATVWTNESDGILPQADIVVKNGKILRIGKNISEPGATIVEAKGKHLTSGIIDEHSHIAIRGGVNEGTESITSEVRIGDVIDPTDINIYRQLAGGTTAAQLLHGSANPIGGQSALIKLRWGHSAEELKIAGADPFIKFALGENVKQSNWGDGFTSRFPQTRAGVEQVFADAFTQAKAYLQESKKEVSTKKRKDNKQTFRRDLELEALAEILNGKRFITCHSYVKSEILMLMRLAERFGFRVNTFTHILEGYKLADKIKIHGAGASTFADWWAYKFEVKDAIPYNAALLHKMGVVTAINSDDAEMGSRLNQEAAKTMKYGGVSEEEAWKMVTLNPAKLLHLDAHMGSIRPGKDADLVLWNDRPLSEYARVEKTFVDGTLYYDFEEDTQLRVAINQERARIIQKMLGVKKKGDPVQKPQPKKERLWHCNDLTNDDLFMKDNLKREDER